MVVFEQKWLYSAKSCSILGTSCCIRANLLYSGKGCSQAKVVVIGQSCCIRPKVVVFGKRGCIRAKVVVLKQKLLYSG